MIDESPRGALIAGEWVATAKCAQIRSPYDQRVVANVYLADVALVAEAVAAAAESQATEFPPWQRAEVLARASALLERRGEEFAHTIVAEAGKPIKQARVEAARAATTLRLSAEEASRLSGEIVPLEGVEAGEGKVGYTLRVPIGVVAAITPFNFPLNLVAHKLGPAIAAGNAVVLKPASQTPLSAIALAKVLLEAGLPHNRLQLVVGPGSTVGDSLITDARVAAVSFTGSREVGWQIAEKAARKRVFLELGSTSPVIVCADGDWRRAADLTAQHAFSYAGQSCISVQRVLVHARIAAQFTDRLTAAVGRLSVGDPRSATTDVGPLIDAPARERVSEWVKAAQGGAQLRCGGAANDDGTYQPTVLAGVDRHDLVWRDEVFGPVVSIRSFISFEDAIGEANDSEFGLQAGVFTDSLTTGLRASRQLEFGGVLINEVPTVRADMQPYGGVKDSGRGREGPAWAVREMTDERLVTWQEAS